MKIRNETIINQALVFKELIGHKNETASKILSGTFTLSLQNAQDVENKVTGIKDSINNIEFNYKDILLKLLNKVNNSSSSELLKLILFYFWLADNPNVHFSPIENDQDIVPFLSDQNETTVSQLFQQANPSTGGNKTQKKRRRNKKKSKSRRTKKN